MIRGPFNSISDPKFWRHKCIIVNLGNFFVFVYYTSVMFTAFFFWGGGCNIIIILDKL